MTRPVDGATAFVDQLPVPVRNGIEVCFSPLMRIDALVQDLDLGDARGVVFTSAQGVRIASTLSDRRDIPCYCVGSATTEVAQGAGWQAQQMGQTGDALVAALIAAPPQGPLVHLSGQHVRGDICDKLSAAGVTTARQVIYDQTLLELTKPAQTHLAGPRPVIAPFFSPRTARHFAQRHAGRAPLWLAALSPAVAEPLGGLDAQALIVAERPDTGAMSGVVELLLSKACRVEADQSPH